MLRRNVTLKQVAEKAGVSVPTISTVLNSAGGNTVVSEETRQRILSAAEKLGYQPNYHAQSLKRGCSMAIGLLLDPPLHGEGGESWLREMARGVEYRARERGYDFVVMGPTPDSPVLDRGTNRAEHGGIDMLVAPGGKPSLKDFKAHKVRVPFVLLWDDRYGTKLPCVTVDEQPGLDAAITHLAGLGHRSTCWVSLDAPGGEPAPQRLAGLRAAAERSGMRIAEARMALPAVEAQKTLAASVLHYRQAAAAMLLTLKPYSALICYNEIVAMGVMQALWESGRRVPQDVSVIGFDDIHARLAHPALSVVSLELQAIGARAVDLGLGILERPRSLAKLHGTSERIAAKFIVRDSTGPACADDSR